MTRHAIETIGDAVTMTRYELKHYECPKCGAFTRAQCALVGCQHKNPLDRAVEAFSALIDADVRFVGGDVVISFGSHVEAIRRMREARDALDALRVPS
jgi:hypothetical protein